MQRSYDLMSEGLLMSCGFHIGQKHDMWKPIMRPYISGFRLGYKFMDVQKSVILFRNALRFLKLSLHSKRPGLVVAGLDLDYKLENEEQHDYFNFSGFSDTLYVVNHRFGGLLTNYKKVRKQYIALAKDYFNFKLPKNLFPAFGIALTRPMPYSLISEFAVTGVPLVALLDSNTVGITKVMFPIISSFASHRSSFFIFRSVLKVYKMTFAFRALYKRVFALSKKDLKKRAYLKSFLRGSKIFKFKKKAKPKLITKNLQLLRMFRFKKTKLRIRTLKLFIYDLKLTAFEIGRKSLLKFILKGKSAYRRRQRVAFLNVFHSFLKKRALRKRTVKSMRKLFFKRFFDSLMESRVNIFLKKKQKFIMLKRSTKRGVQKMLGYKRMLAYGRIKKAKKVL